MKSIFKALLFLMLAASAAAQTRTVVANPAGVVVGPPNFWAANSNGINSVVGTLPSGNIDGSNVVSGTIGEARIDAAISRRSEEEYGTNQWHFWMVGTGGYRARQASSSVVLSSNDFAGLMQYAYESSLAQRVHFVIAPSYDAANHYTFSKTVNLTNSSKFFTIEGAGNPSTVLVPLSTMTPGDPMFRVGSTNHALISSLTVFDGLRFQANLGGFTTVGTNTITGILFENAAEPIVRHCEFSQLYKPIILSTPTSSHWGYAEQVWFVCSTNTSSSAIEFTSNPSTVSDFQIRGGKVNVNGGVGIRLSGGYDNVSVLGVTFDGASAASTAIKVTGGTNFIFMGNTFTRFPATTVPIVFDARGSSEDVRSIVALNTDTGGSTSLLTIGANVTGITVVGNNGPSTIPNWSTTGEASAATAAVGSSNLVLSTTAFTAAAIAADTNKAVMNVGSLILTNPMPVEVGGSGLTNLPAGELLIGNGTNAMDRLQVGSGLTVSGSPGGVRTLSASAGSATNIFSIDVDAFSTNATVTCIYTNTLAAGYGLNLEVNVAGDGPTNSVATKILAKARRGTSGNISKVGTNNTVLGSSGMFAYVDVDTTDQAAKLFVGGLTNEQFHWQAKGWAWQQTNHVATAASTCSLSSEYQTVNNDSAASGGGSILSQQVYWGGGSATICKIRLYLGVRTPNPTITVQIRSDVNGGGSQYGGDSGTQVISSTGWYEFTFASAPTISGAFAINVLNDGNTVDFYVNSAAVYHSGYQVYTGATPHDWGLVFEVHTLQ